MEARLYKIVGAAEWAGVGEVYAGSADDLRDGYIHLSTAAQVAGTLARHFAGRSDLVILEVDAAAIAADLKWEPARGGALFPHLYAPLKRSAIVSERAAP